MAWKKESGGCGTGGISAGLPAGDGKGSDCCLSMFGSREFNERKDVGQIVPWLTKSEIENRASSGKVSFGLREGRDAEEKQAAENALQCFEDGIYRIFAGTEELTDLNQPIIWDDSLEFTFVRLTMLSGW